MKDAQRAERGDRLLREIFGAAGKQAMDPLADAVPDLARYIREFALGEVWSRPGLALKFRELASLSALIALGNADQQLKPHLHGALNLGWTREELAEVVIHLAVYAGFPAAMRAARVLAEVLAERESPSV